MLDQNKDPDRYWYVGKVITSKGKLVHGFAKDQRKPGAIVFYPKTKATHYAGAVIGREYDLKDGLPHLWSDAWTGGEVGEETALAWQTRSQSEHSKHHQKSVDPAPELKAAIEVIRLAMLQNGRQNRMAFIAWLINQLS